MSFKRYSKHLTLKVMLAVWAVVCATVYLVEQDDPEFKTADFVHFITLAFLFGFYYAHTVDGLLEKRDKK